MINIKQVKQEMENDLENWIIIFMNFVDDFRYYKDPTMIKEPFDFNNEKFDALLASTIEYLCNEMGINPPEWVGDVQPCNDPWFVSGMESLKAITIVESPVYFRRRKIFVLENFLVRI
jgi:hypothetical protein